MSRPSAPRPLAVSNIAWPPEALDEALALLPGLGFSAVEIAPFNVFGRWDGIMDEARRLRDRIERHGLRCVALQGIVFNADGVHLFASDGSRALLRGHLEKVAELAEVLGAGACVFGAPRQRDPGELPPDRAWSIALEFLRELGPVFADRRTSLAFEANARRYHCRFVTGTQEAQRLVTEVASPGIGLQIDTGTIFLEGEDAAVLHEAGAVSVHAHVSEPDLRPLGGSGLQHGPLAAALRQSSYRGALSAEMRTAADWRAALIQAAQLLREVYE